MMHDKNYIDKLANKIDSLPKYNLSFTYSVFGNTQNGEYNLVFSGLCPFKTAQAYLDVCWSKKYDGVEFRLNGIKTTIE